MAETQQICPACFRLIPAETGVCPACGADLLVLSARDYRDKLLAALEHPLAEVRMRIVLALGRRGEPEAAEPLAACTLRHPVDVVDALAQLSDAGWAALQHLAHSHPAHAVREAAGRTLLGPERETADA